MRIAVGSWMKWSFLGMALLSAAAFCSPVHSQSAPSVRIGNVDITDIPEDWSHHYVVFSDPGTEQDALRSGRYEQWENVVNNPRYVIQQLKRGARVQGPASLDADYRFRWIAEETGDPFWIIGRVRRAWGLPEIRKDWSQSLGGTGLADGQYPAKYPFATTTASCSDYVVYPTGAGGSGTQATIMAFKNLYVGTGGCGSTNPTVYWAYNTGAGAVANLSPVLSIDGTQVAFIQVSSGGVASLVVLKMANSGGSYNAPTFGTGSGSVTAASYRTCTAPCFTSIALSGNPNDAASAPFYNYDTDVLYVGDNGGKVHLFTGVFSGTPAETTTNWPVTASTTTPPALTSPIYDSVSNRIFVTDQAGYLHTFLVTSPPGSVTTSGRLENNTTNVFEPPIVDGTTELVYTFIGYSGDGGNKNPSYINVFPAAALGEAGTGTGGTDYGTGVHFPNGASGGTANPTTSHMRAGGFDFQYYMGTGTTGNIYTCENGTIYQIPLATIATFVVNVYNTPVSAVGIASACSAVTEFQSVSTATTINSTGVTSTTQTTIPVASVSGMSTAAPNNYLLVGSEIMKITAVGATSVTVTRGSLGTTAGSSYPSGTAAQVIQDWMFTSVEANASVSPCTAGCLLNYSVLGAGTAGSPTTGFPAAGGTSGIVIDNQVPGATQAGAEQIYYNLITGTTNNAIQASQSNP